MYRFHIKAFNAPNHKTFREYDKELGPYSIRKDNDEYIVNFGYGYESYWGNRCREGKDSALPGREYRIFHQLVPHEGDEITHVKSGRKFIVGPVTGFLIYFAPLLENGVEVAKLMYEDYYKD